MHDLTIERKGKSRKGEVSYVMLEMRWKQMNLNIHS